MIGELPKSLEVDGVSYPINSDFRAVLLIFEAFGDESLSPLNKRITMLEIIYTPLASEDEPEPEPNIPPNEEEAVRKALWFLDVGIDEKNKKSGDELSRTMDYAQDEQLIFAAVNPIFAKDIREESYLHWWTFYGLCQAINPDSLISHIVSIRSKKAKGKKLEKYEQEFYAENRHLIDFRTSEDDYEKLVRELRK